MPKVLNKRYDKIPTDSVYVGRPSKWGNPYSHLPNTLARYRVSTREEAIQRYVEYIVMKLCEGELDITELKNKDLVCWCHPLPCHADILMELAND